MNYIWIIMDLCCATADPRKIQKDDKLVFNKLPNEPKNGMPPDRNPHLHSTYHVLTSLVPEACALSPFSLRELNLRESTKLGTFQPLSRISLKKLAIKAMLQITDLSGEGCSIPIIIFFHDVNYIPWISLDAAFQFVFATAEFGPFFAKFRRLLEQSGC